MTESGFQSSDVSDDLSSCSQESPDTGLLEQATLHRMICKGSDAAPKGNCLIQLLQGLHQPSQVPVSHRDSSVAIPYKHRIIAFSQLSTNNVQQGGKIYKDIA